jgi:hypothetical protein
MAFLQSVWCDSRCLSTHDSDWTGEGTRSDLAISEDYPLEARAHLEIRLTAFIPTLSQKKLLAIIFKPLGH